MRDIPGTPGSRPGLAAALADRYRIERELGRGGMAVVYLAHDVKHDRKVALKILQPDVAEGVKTERFLREIQLAARLSHPNILPLFDSGEAAGVLFYAMPFVEGESLRDRLTREQRLPVDEALRITREVAAALAYAHGHGVVHRDIKPENILLQAGQAVVADFGIARAVTAAQGSTVTQSGVAVGTPAYMSPEQGAGSGELDGRGDLYSLGCVLYEMLAGHPPFAGATTQELLARHVMDPVPSLKAARPGVPEGVERAVLRALAKTREDRFATAGEFAAALAADAVRPTARPPDRRVGRRLAALAVGAVVVAGGVALAARTDLLRPAAPAASAQSVAVLPFVNLSGDTTNDYFSDGMTEELINALTQVEGLRVPARTSSFAFKGKNTDIKQIGQQLGVARVLEGSVRRVETLLRVTAQLINVADGYHLWSQTYEREVRSARDVFAIQDELSRAIVGALSVKLASGAAARPVPRSTENLAAYDDYLRGRYFWNRRSRDDMLKAIDYFHQAIKQDSGFALAWSGLADASVEAGRFTYLPRARVYAEAKTAALHALALDSSLAEAHTSLARVRLNYDRDWSGAEQEYQRAIQLSPRYALAHGWYGGLLAGILGRFDQGIAEARLGYELDPLSPGASHNLGYAFLHARRYDLAIQFLRQAVELQPDWGAARQTLGTAYLFKGLYQEALAEFQAELRVGGNTGAALARIGVVYARQGKRQDALDILRQIKERSKTEFIASFSIAILHVELGDNDQAIEWLERAWADRVGNIAMIGIKTNAFFDPLRSDPRFQALLKKMGLGE